MCMIENLKGPREWWQSYAVHFPPHASDVQRRETYKAFVAGMLASLLTVKIIGNLSSDEYVAYLENFEAILNQMKDEISGG